MSKKPLIIIAIVVVAFLVIGGVVLALNSNSDSDTDSTPTTADTTTPPATTTPDTDTGTDTTPAAKTVTLTFTNGTFSPSTVTLNVGDTLLVKNAGGSLAFDSDPHPVHTDNPELNLGDIEDGSSKSVVVKNKGTWGVHNHENSSNTATVIIQ